MQNRLTLLLGDTPRWRYSARVLRGLAAFMAGNAGAARLILTPVLVDRSTPQSILERAQIVLAEIASGEIAKKAGNLAPAPAATAAEGTPAVDAPAKTKKE
jgi:hypothetical protein